ncbi:hypothetical protein ISN44_As07g006600 [Arabidopsis suecica]|uniref:Uncharacterized protein n=1 Tax=Arabidopsis suecica TaxID=45249 RepID=A0A8T2BLQ1_ARASU|nr:hypothetical protein ISN44_As07g006600 [Arabidopsis suecica]
MWIRLTRWIINYESKTHTVGSKTSGTFSIRIIGVERTLIRSPSGRESLVTQRTEGKTKDAAVVIVSEIPLAFLAGEEICSGYVANVLSKKGINSSVKNHIIPKICEDAINMSRRLGEEETKGFLVEAEVEVSQESSHSNLLSFDDYDSQGIVFSRGCTESIHVQLAVTTFRILGRRKRSQG